MTEPWTFAMVTPDAVIGGYLDFVLERIAAHGLAVRATRVIGLDYARLGRMYTHKDNPPPSAPDAKNELPERVMTALYRHAPACVLVLRGDCATMLACKGATRPESAAAGSVRAAGENIIFNFVHCPDDQESAAIELGYLLGKRDALALRNSTGPMLDVAQLRRCLPAFAGWEVLSFPLIANRIGCRLVQQLAPGPESLGDAHALLLIERKQLEAARSAAERMRIVSDGRQAIHGALAAASGDDPTVLNGLRALAELCDPRGARELEPIWGLGVYVSELEKVALDAHQHAFTS